MQQDPSHLWGIGHDGQYFQAEADERWGRGAHARLRDKMDELKRAVIFFSLSFAVTRTNFDTVTDACLLQKAVQAG